MTIKVSMTEGFDGVDVKVVITNWESNYANAGEFVDKVDRCIRDHCSAARTLSRKVDSDILKECKKVKV